MRAPANWREIQGTGDQVSTIAVGDAQIAIWRYKRTEPLPVTRSQLHAARQALVAQVEHDDKTFELTSTRLVIKPGLRGVEIVGEETNHGQRRSVRSLHAYANGYEVVVDCFAPPKDFPRVDKQTFGPVGRSLRLSVPQGVSRRAFVIVADACGAGALPDAEAYGDAGANTLAHVADAVGGLDLPILGSLGLGNVLELRGVPPAAAPVAHGRLATQGPGKDSTTGHWELMGAIAPAPQPTYPDGFPADVVERARTRDRPQLYLQPPVWRPGRHRRLRPEHLEDGALILYTSQDSVLQIAAHDDRLSEANLHAVCEVAREVMRGEHAVGRVIARPFTGAPGAFRRTEGRHDYALSPPSRTYLQELQAAGVPVHAVGKVQDLFSGEGIDHAHPGASNARALAETSRLVAELESGLVFVNLVETDMLFGHRKDVAGFHAALREIDKAVGGWLERLDPARDLLVITADHGCDPAAPHSDHTREYAPLLARFEGHEGRRHDGALADVGASVLRWLTGEDAPALPGTPFVG